ncbi:nitroreductase [Desulfitobacterium hafniense DCB-2]|uniref:Nitroreductase n=1 Tax=Desulfitobacterium hafniense (strain DSM 10664 / DCB-2) TaxID=272564 RepID=B8FQJ6_DESHD|nr:nitroreductase [Desulfitobacterium hafniense DCB-2]
MWMKIMVNIDSEKCIGCGLCVRDCFPGKIVIVEGKAQIKNKQCMQCGHCIAICPQDAVSMIEYNMAEVKAYDRREFSVDADILLNFIKYRRSCRQFIDKEVEEEKISKIIEAGRYTQTGSNLQDVSYIVVREGLQELTALAIESLKETGEALLANPAPQTLGLKRYAELWLKMYEGFQANPQENDRLFFNAPAVIIVTANSEVNGVLASSNMELMTNALGLGTVFSGFFIRAAQDNQRILDFLGIKEGKKIVTCMVIGYPAVRYFRTVPRKEADISWK